MLPERVKVPLPTFTRLPLPLMTPLYVVLLLSPVVSVKVLRFTLPAPAKEAMVSFAATLYVAPLMTFTAVLSDKLPVTLKVPALIVVVPV